MAISKRSKFILFLTLVSFKTLLLTSPLCCTPPHPVFVQQIHYLFSYRNLILGNCVCACVCGMYLYSVCNLPGCWSYSTFRKYHKVLKMDANVSSWCSCAHSLLLCYKIDSLNQVVCWVLKNGDRVIPSYLLCDNLATLHWASMETVWMMKPSSVFGRHST